MHTIMHTALKKGCMRVRHTLQKITKYVKFNLLFLLYKTKSD